MAFVSETAVTFPGDGKSGSFEVPVNTGDVLVALVWAQRIEVEAGTVLNDLLVSVPTGWSRLRPADEPDFLSGGIFFGSTTGDPVVVPVWTRVSSSGTATGTFTWDVESVVRQTAGVRILRYSGMKGVAGHAAQMASNDRVTYPAVETAAAASPNGHAVRVAITNAYSILSATDLVPASGHTLRADQVTIDSMYTTSRLVVSDQTLTATKPGEAVASSPSQVFAHAITLYVASDVGPPPPTITLPASLIADFGVPWRLEWDPSGPQTAVRITRQNLTSGGAPTGTVEYLTSVSSPAWSTTPTTVTSTTSRVDFPASQFATGGQRYRITVATVGGTLAPDLGAPAAVDIRSFDAPTVSSVTLSPVSGGAVTSRTPMITVTGAPGAGAGISTWEGEIFDATTGVVYARNRWGWIPSWTVTVDQAIPNGATVRVRGRVWQNAVMPSPWIEAGPYTVVAPRHPAPTITVAPTTHPTSGLPGAAVTVTSPAGNVAVYRDGVLLDTWPSDGTLTIADYDAPGGTSQWTAVRLASETLDDSLPSAPATYTLSVDGDNHCWLTDPRHPEDAIQVHAVDVTEGIGRPSAVYHALQDAAPVAAIVQSLPRHAAHGTITLDIDTPDELEAVTAMLTAGRPLTYRRWVERDVRDGTATTLPALRFRPVGDVSITRPGEGPMSWRHVSVAWVATE